MKHSIKSTLILPLLLILVLPDLTTAQHQGHNIPSHSAKQGMHTMPMGMRGMEALRKLYGRQFDIAFLSQMIEHHREGVQMARDELTNGERSEVKAIARNIVRAQTKEISDMTRMLKVNYKTKPSQQQITFAKEDSESMMAMKVTNDTLFLDMMTQHHQHAIEMAQLARQKAKGAAVKKLAHMIIQDQTKENARMSQMREKTTHSAGMH